MTVTLDQPSDTWPMHSQEMIRSHPSSTSAPDGLASCIDECYTCSQTCTACADACLAEDMVADLRRCVRLNLDCADVCSATGALLTRLTEANDAVIRAQLAACAEACRACAEECDRHAGMHDHCRTCADACRRCEAACKALLG